MKYLFMQTFGERCSIRFSDCCFPSLAWWGGVGAAAPDSNTISSVICCSCQWLFGGNCGNLFHYFSLSIVPLPLRLLALLSSTQRTPVKARLLFVLENLSTKALRWIYHCMIHVLLLPECSRISSSSVNFRCFSSCECSFIKKKYEMRCWNF